MMMYLLNFLILFLSFQLSLIHGYVKRPEFFNFNIYSPIHKDLSLFVQLKKRLFHVTTVDGLEDILAEEIRTKVSDIEKLEVQKKGVTFLGTTKSGFEALLWLRTSLKIMEKIDTSHLGAENDQIFLYDKDDLYDFISLIDWKEMIHYDQTIKCDATISSTSSPTLTHSHFTALTIKNAIIDQFRNYYQDNNCRPDVDLEEPMLPLLLYLHRNEALLYRVWSGEGSMHKRGYRSDSVIHKASLRETTAAGLVLRSRWNGKETYFCDPMCGSGTIAVEAALIAAETAPGLLRYSLSDAEDRSRPVPLYWKDIQAEDGKQLWKEIYQTAQQKDQRRQIKEKLIYVNDIVRGSIDLARSSASKAGVMHLIEFVNKDIADYYLPLSEKEEEDSDSDEKKFTIVTNPPWDKRLDSMDDESWEKLNEFLLDSTNQLDRVFVLNGNPSLTRIIQLKPWKILYINAAKTPMDLLIYNFRRLEKSRKSFVEEGANVK